MKPLIPPQDYCDAATFKAERERIFLRHWIFAATTYELSANEDYRCLEVGGIPVVLQNFEGNIRAFTNICSHRFARLQVGSGNRELKCPYHGWIYNEEGLPYAIPHKPHISEITPSTLCEYRLARWHVRSVGPLVFIKQTVEGELLAVDDLEQQFGEYYSPIADCALACGEVVENTDHLVTANWKLVVENTLEGYHVDCVHPNTIKKLGMTGLTKNSDGMKSEKNIGSQFSFSGNNSAVLSPLDPEVTAKLDRTYKFLANRPQKLEGYRHYYFFPGFVFASTRGESFSIQRILPIDEQTTQLTSYLFATNGLGDLSKMEMALKKQFYLAAADFVRSIFAEDVAICENVQRSVRFAQGRGVLSDEEERICAFHRAYRQTMGANN